MDLAKWLPWIVAWAMVFGPLSSWYARRRARQPFIWFLYGACLGPLAALLLAAAPPARCPSCDEPVVGWAARCPSCGMEHQAHLHRWIAFAVGVVSWIHELSTPDLAAAAQGGEGNRDAHDPDDDRPLERLPAGHEDGRPTALVASGLFVSGASGLEAGARYALARHGDFLWVLGPLEIAPDVVRFERRLETMEFGADGSTLTVTDRTSPTRLLLSFESVITLDRRRIRRIMASVTPANEPASMATPPAPNA